MLGALPPGTVPGRSPGARRGHRGHRSGRFAPPQRSFPPASTRSRAIDTATISRMTEPSGPTIRVPRWVQLVGLPVGLLIIWMLAGVLGHVLFLFLTAS